jgi:Secretion system C-terminal sorting domain/SprB repeat
MRSKTYTKAPLLHRVGLAFTLVILLGTSVMAQSFTENFNTVSTLFTSGWAQQNLSTPVGTAPNWFQGSGTVFIAQSGADSSYIGCNFNSVAGAATISNWLFTPTRTFANGHTISFWSRTVAAPAFPDRLEVRLSTSGSSVNVGTTNASVGDYTTLLLTINPTLTTTGYPNVWTQYTITISGLGAPTSGRIAFRYFVPNGGPSGANSDFIGIDNYSYTVPAAANLKMNTVDTLEYTITPENHQFPGPYNGTILNVGTAAITNAFMQVNVYDGAGTQVYTANSATTANLAVGASAAKSVPAPTGLAPDFYTIEYIAKHSAVDGNPLDDTLYNGILVDPSQYARDNGSVTGGLGIGAGGGYLGQQYHLYQADQIDSILVYVTKGYTGQPMAAVVWDMASGIPNNIIASTDTILYPNDLAGVYVLPIHGGSFPLPVGDFVVTFVEFDSTARLGATSAIFTPGTTWIDWPASPAGGWANNEFFANAAFMKPYVIRPIMSLCPAYASTVTSTQSACGGATGTASINVTGGPGPFTYQWSNSQTTATATNLAAGTYTVTVTDGGGCTVTGTATVSNPNAPTIGSITPTPASCNGGNGGAVVVAAGGTAPYTYLWSNNATTATITAPAGSYTVTVTDVNGCIVNGGPAVVTEPSAITANMSSTLESTPGANDASASVVATGGTPPFTYSWSNGATTPNVSGLGAGAISVTVTDANGCTGTGSVSVIVGIDPIAGKVTFGAYPNPNDGTFQIVIGTTDPADIHVEIVDIVGKVVYQSAAQYATEFKREVNLGGSASGIYFIRMKAGDLTRTLKVEVKR